MYYIQESWPLAGPYRRRSGVPLLPVDLLTVCALAAPVRVWAHTPREWSPPDGLQVSLRPVRSSILHTCLSTYLMNYLRNLPRMLSLRHRDTWGGRESLAACLGSSVPDVRASDTQSDSFSLLHG